MRPGLLSVHGAVLLFGLAGLFGKLLSLSPIQIVWWRNLFAALALGVAVLMARKHVRAPAGRARYAMVPIGAVLAFHWVTFFHAIQVSTVAVGLLSFSTFPVMVALLEPLLPGERFHARSLMFAVIAFVGVALVVPSIDPDSPVFRGAAWGVLSGLLYAVTTVLNRRYVKQSDALSLGLWQNAVAFLVLLPFNLSAMEIDARSVGLTALLGVVFTGGAHALFIHGMREVPARLASLIGTLEPVYGVVAAALLLGEIPSPRTIAGGALILVTVLAASQRR